MPTFDPATLAFAVGLVFLGAGVRGLTGFGAAMIWVGGLALVLPPREVVPTVLMLEMAASLALLPSTGRAVAWREVTRLALWAAAGVPAGIAVLALMPADLLRVIVAALILIATLALLFAERLRFTPDWPHRAGAGLISGLFNGAAGIPGPPVVLYLLSAGTPPHVARASFMAYFLIIDAVAIAMMAVSGLVTPAVFTNLVFALPAMGLGLWAGHHGFVHLSVRAARRLMLVLVAGLSVALIVRASFL